MAVETDVEAQLGPERLPPEVETALYRIVQEALTNVMKHARASHVSILLMRKERSAVAVVEDNGVGFVADGDEDGGGLGLIGMRERVALLDGRLEVESSPRGTTIVAEVPLP
jgi:signal transduction histidine kinase